MEVAEPVGADEGAHNRCDFLQSPALVGERLLELSPVESVDGGDSFVDCWGKKHEPERVICP